MTQKDLIVIGASAGGLPAIRQLLSLLPATFPACVLVVLHISSRSRGSLPAIFARSAALPVFGAVHGAALCPGRVYVAPPDYHLLAGPSSLVLDRGPRVNRARPAIDPLFCSAAALFGPRVVGVVLTGLLGDGSAGLLAIKRAGGVAVVQDPDDAEFADMPETALSRVSVDHCAPLHEIPELLWRLVVCPTSLVAGPTSDLEKVTARYAAEPSSARASAPARNEPFRSWWSGTDFREPGALGRPEHALQN
jgi:two-component system, chemotaxis family, protein-glutamate methylesterase/glutaminase